METYHRKRSKGTTANLVGQAQEVMSLKMQETSSSTVDGQQTKAPSLARQYFLPQSDGETPDHDIELGSVYEIYHRNLPPRTPAQLRSTRVVMVSEKTDLNVAIRYPSIGSLRNYFSNRIREMYPALDEKFMMGTKLAGKVLLRQVPSQEFSEKKHLEEFWLVNANSQGGLGNVVTKKEDIGLARELKNSGMVTWGVRRQVMFIGRHRETSKSQSSSSVMQGDIDQVNDEHDEEEEEETHEYNPKRKGKSDRNMRKRKQVKREDQLWLVNTKPKKKLCKLPPKDPTNRWSKERYMAAEQSLLEVMKEKKAMIGNPIIRHELRLEARKRIGDTGLLDHLLKHVANKVAPGGILRFRRWHNADGTMEYWLENADLMKIRKEAGVSDPFWTPPPGWKLGDSPIQDPFMAKELNQLKEEISNIKGIMCEFVSRKQFEEDLSSFRREINELTTKNKQDKSQAIVTSDSVDTASKHMVKFSDSLFHSGSNAVVPMEKYKEQMLAISNSLKKIEEWMHGEEMGLISEKPKETEKQKAGAGGERQKCGFRVCKLQGTFLWPNYTNKNMSNCQQQQAEVVPTPTPLSVDSSAISPVKPVAERRAITISGTTVVSEEGHKDSSTTINHIPHPMPTHTRGWVGSSINN